MGKKTSFADMVAELPPAPDTRHQTWFDKLPEEAQADLLDFKKCYKAGRYKDKTLGQLIDLIRKTFSVQRGRAALESWLKSE